MKIILSVFLALLLMLSCADEPLISSDAQADYWLSHEGALLPITVEGNTASGLMIIMVHGGPGGSSHEYNVFNQPWSDLLEAEYAMAYYDQRNAGISRGDFDSEKFTIEQHIEDLDLVINFLRSEFGETMQFVLCGHSWGTYLGCAYLLDADHREKVLAWIALGAGTHRNEFMRARIQHIRTVAEDFIAQGEMTSAWQEVLDDLQEFETPEFEDFNLEKELQTNPLRNRVERLIGQSDIFSVNTSGGVSSLYGTRFHQFTNISHGNRSNDDLVRQMYTYDERIELQRSQIDLPIFMGYGRYDIRTAPNHAPDLLDNIGTDPSLQELVIYQESGHSPMRTEVDELAGDMIQFIKSVR